MNKKRIKAKVEADLKVPIKKKGNSSLDFILNNTNLRGKNDTS